MINRFCIKEYAVLYKEVSMTELYIFLRDRAILNGAVPSG